MKNKKGHLKNKYQKELGVKKIKKMTISCEKCYVFQNKSVTLIKAHGSGVALMIMTVIMIPVVLVAVRLLAGVVVVVPVSMVLAIVLVFVEVLVALYPEENLGRANASLILGSKTKGRQKL